MAVKQLSLYESARGKLRISRVGALTMLVVDGQGLALAPTADFSVIEKWAKSKPAGPNATIDMGKIIEKLDVLVCRPGTTFASTRGSTKPLEGVVKEMRAAGMDVKEFQLPPELKEAPVPEKPKPQKGDDAPPGTFAKAPAPAPEPAAPPAASHDPASAPFVRRRTDIEKPE